MTTFSGISRRGVLAGGLAAGLLARPALARSAPTSDDLRFAGVFGETILPAPAKRVVSLGYTTQDPLLALGVVPLATREWYGGFPSAVWPWAQPLLGAAKPQVLTAEISPEIVASLAPDLIVGVASGLSEAEYKLLSRIAPVLMQPPETQDYGLDWAETTRLIGRAVGESEKAEALIEETRGKFRAARERHPDWEGKTAVAAYSFGGDVGAFIAPDARVAFLSELGFVSPPGLAQAGKPAGFYTSLSPEDLAPLDADLVLWVAQNSEAPAIRKLTMRKALRARREGREVFSGDLISGALSFGSVLSLPLALERLEPEIVAALDGDPATPVASAVEAGLAP